MASSRSRSRSSSSRGRRSEASRSHSRSESDPAERRKSDFRDGKSADRNDSPQRNRSVSRSRSRRDNNDGKVRARSQSSSDVSDVDRTKPKARKEAGGTRMGDRVIEKAVEDAVKEQRIVEVGDFLEDSLTMRLLNSVLNRSGRRFLEDVLYEAVDSINRDVRSREEVRIPQKYVGIRVKRVVQRKEDDMAYRRRGRERENRSRRRDSRSLSRSRSPYHRISVSDMCDKYRLDAECEDRLRELRQDQLSRVFGPDLLIRNDCRNPSSIVMSRIRDEVRGRSWRRPRRFRERRPRSYSRDRWHPSSSRSSSSSSSSRSYSRSSPRKESKSRMREGSSSSRSRD